MNVNNFKESFAHLSNETAITLNPVEAAIIESSLIVLKNENKFDDIYFWGQIEGTESDYFIAFGYAGDLLMKRTYFYSKNGRDWYLLIIEKSVDTIRASQLAPNCLEGDLALVTEVDLDPTFTMDGDRKYTLTMGETFKLKEEDRLACLVRCITDESAIIPRGALYKKLSGETVPNPAFAGITQSDAKNITNFQLFREPCNRWELNLLRRPSFNYTTDFLDTIDCIVPENHSFALITDLYYDCVYLKSLHWPGMVFFHKTNSNLHGFVYFGDGRKNLDMLFMI